VLYTNPRGSTGYGEEFGNIIHTKYPGDDFTDLMKGVDKMIEKGYIDPKKLCVTGGSGGGLLTAWTIGHTDRFAAAVSQYPVTNWITQAGTADGGYTHSALWLKSFPWENPKQFLDRSPIFFAKNFKTPTMVITGEADLAHADRRERGTVLRAQSDEGAGGDDPRARRIPWHPPAQQPLHRQGRAHPRLDGEVHEVGARSQGDEQE
jgi:dienelactone hydrolase